MWPLLRPSSFNEAEALTPRIARLGKANRGGARRRFNEAEALTPRIEPLFRHGDTLYIYASMRPRH